MGTEAITMDEMSGDREARYPWIEGFDAIFDIAFAGSLEDSLERQFTLSELGVLSFEPDFLNRIPLQAIRHIKSEQGYVGATDAVKFALGARAGYKTLRTSIEEQTNV